MQITNDSEAVKKMAKETEEIISKLERNVSTIESDLNSLSSRWNDENYKSLANVINDRKSDLKELLKELKQFRQWLDDLQKKLYSYENAPKLK
jgi:predicted  nucleic acid-binding Zn-ribbon protein